MSTTELTVERVPAESHTSSSKHAEGDTAHLGAAAAAARRAEAASPALSAPPRSPIDIALCRTDYAVAHVSAERQLLDTNRFYHGSPGITPQSTPQLAGDAKAEGSAATGPLAGCPAEDTDETAHSAGADRR